MNMQITLTHNSELRLRKAQAMHALKGMEYPVSGDSHYPSVGEEMEVAKYYTPPSYAQAMVSIFKKTQQHKDLTAAVDALEVQETLF